MRNNKIQKLVDDGLEKSINAVSIRLATQCENIIKVATLFMTDRRLTKSQLMLNVGLVEDGEQT